MASLSKNFIILFLFLLPPFFLHSTPQQWEGKIKTENGVVIVENPAKPIASDNSLELSPEFVIPGNDKMGAYSLVRVNDMAVDENGVIYLYDRKESSIFIFNTQGKFLRKFGRAGLGPGELDGVSEIEVFGRRLFALAAMTYRVHIFEIDGTYLESLTIPTPLNSLHIDKEGRFFAELFSRQIYSIVQCDSEMKVKTTYADKKWEAPRFWQFLISYTLSPEGDIIVGTSSGYGLDVYENNGRLKKTIHKNSKPIPLPKAEVKYLENMKASFFAIPTTYDPFYNLYSDDQGRIIINTHTFLAGPKTAFYDVFSSEGKFFANFELPYYSQLIWKNGRLYVVDEDDEGYPLVRVFKVRWKTE
jgi:hypothetical protein